LAPGGVPRRPLLGIPEMNTSTNHRTTTLEDVLTYSHQGVLHRYARENHASPEEAAEVFQEMLKFLYTCYRAAENGVGFVVSNEIEKIDWMWHTFLVYTMDYADFCDRYFGLFLHHSPNEAADERVLDDEAVRATAERQFGLVYDVLGAETLTKWYDECRYAAA
jgi:hypothetical protein